MGKLSREEIDQIRRAVGARIRERRLAAGLSRVELSNASGVSVSSIYRIETSRTDLRVESLGRIADA
jgi:transcriptional regulator with XRE-family HTH domain